MNSQQQKGPSIAFVGISWPVLVTGIITYNFGLWSNEFAGDMELNDQGYYLVVLMYAVFSVISVQESVRDKLEGIPVTNIYYALSWGSSIASILFLIVGLWNADMETAEKRLLRDVLRAEPVRRCRGTEEHSGHGGNPQAAALATVRIAKRPDGM
jgi:uncharacterized membrane protein YiaA